MKTKVMIYISEDKQTYGYKQVKFDIPKGAKVLNRETSKINVSLGTYDLGDRELLKIKQTFCVYKKYCTLDSIEEKARSLSLLAERITNGEQFII